MSGLDEKGLADAVKAHNDAYWTVTNDSEGARKRMEKAISAYLSAVGQKAGTVEVKALEWDEITVARSNEDPTHEPTGDYEACTPFGHYEIEQYFGSDSYGWQVTFDTFVVADKDDPDAAKAAAQSHYESRIRSAIVSVPVEAEDTSTRDWTEDFSGENGNYQCRCIRCDKLFIGHKRRVVCGFCALIPAPSVAEAAEPVAWRYRYPNYERNTMCEWTITTDGLLAEAIAHRDGEFQPLFTHPAPSPVVPSGLEALVERLRSAGCHYGIPVERDFAEAADAIAALIAERDEAHGMIEIIKKAHGVSIENGNVLRSDLSAALNWIAEIEGETREHEPVAYMVHNAMIVRNVNSIRQPGEIDETTVWLYPAARADHAREAAKTLRADLTPLYRKVQADDE